MNLNLITRDLSPDQIAALETLVEAIGEFNFKISSLLRAINSCNTAEIEKQWPRWAIVDGKIDKVKLRLRILELNKFMGM